jgi:hypothetical protein
MNTHVCKYMNNGQGPQTNYVYKWTGDVAGWQLLSDDKPVQGKGYSWVCSCNWCGERLPVLETAPPLDYQKTHRCHKLVHHEWRSKQYSENNLGVEEDFFDEDEEEVEVKNVQAKQQETFCFYIAWDGFAWNMMNGDEVTEKRLKYCPHCEDRLPDPRMFRNKVEIL